MKVCTRQGCDKYIPTTKRKGTRFCSNNCCMKNWVQTHLDRKRMNAREWKRANPECGRKWALANTDKIHKSLRKWKLSHPDGKRKWAINNPLLKALGDARGYLKGYYPKLVFTEIEVKEYAELVLKKRRSRIAIKTQRRSQ
jgi:hypothetical protein